LVRSGVRSSLPFFQRIFHGYQVNDGPLPNVVPPPRFGPIALSPLKKSNRAVLPGVDKRAKGRHQRSLATKDGPQFSQWWNGGPVMRVSASTLRFLESNIMITERLFKCSTSDRFLMEEKLTLIVFIRLVMVRDEMPRPFILLPFCSPRIQTTWWERSRHVPQIGEFEPRL